MGYILKSARFKECLPFGSSYLGCAWVVRGKRKGYWRFVDAPHTCRTYLSCALYKTTKDLKYHNYHQYINVLPPEKDSTCIFFASGTGEEYQELVNNVEKTIHKLHEIEDRAGVSHTSYEVINNGVLGVVFIGDVAWRSTLWKSTLYSWYLKRVCIGLFKPKKVNKTYGYSGEEIAYLSYQKHLDIYEDQLLAKVKDFNEEVIPSNQFRHVHTESGFVSICTKVNTTMYNLLGLKEKK